MKKIIALVLVLVTALALTACSLFKKDKGTTDGSASIDDYNDAIEATQPTTATIRTTYKNTDPEVTLEGEYIVTYNIDGTATVNYTYDRLAALGSPEMIEKKTGKVEVLTNGTVSGDLDKVVTAAAVNTIKLDGKKMEYDISMGVLNAVVKAEDTKDIFGVDLGADAALDMRITDDGRIGSYSINYATSAGRAYIVCIFN